MDQQQVYELARTLNVAGGILGAIIGCFGGLVGYLAARGKARRFAMGGMIFFVVLGVCTLIAGAVMAFGGLPRPVYWPALLMGVIITGVVGPMFFVIRKRYREADARRMEAAALRAS